MLIYFGTKRQSCTTHEVFLFNSYLVQKCFNNMLPNIIILLTCLFVKSVVCAGCYWNADCKYKYFSSKTPYEFVRGDIRDTFVKQKGMTFFLFLCTYFIRLMIQ